MPQDDLAQNFTQLYRMAHKYNISALITACRLVMVKYLRTGNAVLFAIEGYLCKDDKLKNAAISVMGKESLPLRNIPNWAALQKYPALSLEIADRCFLVRP